jgi:hypothetical protein
MAMFFFACSKSLYYVALDNCLLCNYYLFIYIDSFIYIKVRKLTTFLSTDRVMPLLIN